MRITEDVRKYAAERGLTDTEAIESGMQEKRKEFLEKGSEVYAKTQSCSRLALSRRLDVWGAHAPRVLVSAPSPKQSSDL